MPPYYASDPVEQRDVEIDDATLLAIGHLIRACAEVEDLITIWLCKLADVDEAMAPLFIGKMPVSNRLRLAKYLADMHGGEFPQTHENMFGAGLPDLLACRNAVAHGVLLGKDDEDRWLFLTPTTVDPVEEHIVTRVKRYRTEAIAQFAWSAELCVPVFEQVMHCQKLRQERREQSLRGPSGLRRSKARVTRRKRPPEAFQG